MATSTFSKAYNSFSGVDIKAVFNEKPVGDLQAISYSVTREKAPLYTMGSPDPRSFSRGKRGIAGSLIFIVFDRHGLLETMNNAYFVSDVDDIRPVQNRVSGDASFGATLVTGGVDQGDPTARPVYQQESALSITNIASDQLVVSPWFSDQIPPFDVTLSANNEYGASAKMVIYGLEILNEGSGVSIDDIMVEQQMTYVARTMSMWQYVQNGFRTGSPSVT